MATETGSSRLERKAAHCMGRELRVWRSGRHHCYFRGAVSGTMWLASDLNREVFRPSFWLYSIAGEKVGDLQPTWGSALANHLVDSSVGKREVSGSVGLCGQTPRCRQGFLLESVCSLEWLGMNRS